jgi:hypothetical protein
MSKEETPITEYEFYKEFETNLRSINYSDKSGNNLLMEWFRQSLEQYAQAKVLEALEREVPKACMKYNSTAIFNKKLALEYYETEVKPKYR